MAEAGGTSDPVHFFRCRAMALFWKIPSQRQHVPTEGRSVMLGLHPGAWGSYRSSAWAVITMTSPKIAAIIFMVVHVFKLCRSEEHTSELQSLRHLVCRLLLEKKQK